MDKVIKMLNEEIEGLLAQVKELEAVKANWIAFNNGTASVQSLIEKPREVLIVTSDATKTNIERVNEIIKDHNSEMYSSQIAKILLPNYPGKDLAWVKTRVSSILSDEKNLEVYSYLRREKGEHHLAKVWGVNSFKDKNGNVKDEHKYKSTP